MVEALGRGLAAPAGLSVAGIDNVEFAADLAPSLTIMGIRATAIGRESAAQADRETGVVRECRSALSPGIRRRVGMPEPDAARESRGERANPACPAENLRAARACMCSRPWMVFSGAFSSRFSSLDMLLPSAQDTRAGACS
ncbi:hypothetical protein, partial [Roseinatronobacter sp.]|uniref:hypothetical protein n=1 Tax=Roseinatronobacter sp. TaxID=1945755 RepID=UPI003F6E64C9